MKIRQLLLIAAAIVLSFSTVVYADSINQRVRHAYERIDRGIHRGALTREEAHRLKRELRGIRDEEAQMLADGRLSHHERERLNRQLDRLERHISNLKHNDERRDYDRGGYDRGGYGRRY